MTVAALASFFLNTAIAVLLITVIVYCRKLNANIKILQDSKSEMAKLFAEFDVSIEKAEQSVQDLQEATHKAEGALKDKLDKANIVADDLTFMIERGIKMADQLEHGKARTAPAQQAAARPAAPAPQALRPAAPAAQQPAPAQQAAPQKDNKLGPLAGKTMSRKEAQANAQGSAARTTASIESVLEQMANRNNPKEQPKPGEKKTNTRIRSKAEQELFDSLKSGR